MAGGWIKDLFGLSWKIVPSRFTELLRDTDPRKVKAVMAPMMTMVKLDVAELRKTYNEASICIAPPMAFGAKKKAAAPGSTRPTTPVHPACRTGPPVRHQ